nr:MAG TPA: hypothetical protein [Caudoviricetes sp.]
MVILFATVLPLYFFRNPYAPDFFFWLYRFYFVPIVTL